MGVDDKARIYGPFLIALELALQSGYLRWVWNYLESRLIKREVTRGFNDNPWPFYF